MVTKESSHKSNTLYIFQLSNTQVLTDVDPYSEFESGYRKLIYHRCPAIQIRDTQLFGTNLQKTGAAEEEDDEVKGEEEDGGQEESDEEDGRPYVRSKDPLPKRITDHR